MTSQELIDELNRLIQNPAQLNQSLEAWQRACNEHLSQLPEPEASQLVGALQTIIRENRLLFERENAALMEQLAEPSAKSRQAKAKKYSDVDRLNKSSR